MSTRVSLLLFVAALTSALCVPVSAEPRIEPSARGSNWFVTLDPLFLQTAARTGGRVNLALDDSDTPGTDLSLRGADGVDHAAHAPRATFGWRWNHGCGGSAGLQARFFDLKDAVAGRARPTPGTTPLPNFATTSERNSLELYTGDVEGALAYSGWGFTLEGTYGTRSARFRADGELEAFGVFTPGNFVQLQFSNGSAFEGDGRVQGFSLAYRIPGVPVSVFVGRRVSTLEGESDSFGRVVGTVASSPGAPLVGAATVTRNDEERTDLEIGETRYGIQADFGAPDARFRSFARCTYERMRWALDGPPTGGAGFGGTLNGLTTNGFSSAGLGSAELEGWSLALGMAF